MAALREISANSPAGLLKGKTALQGSPEPALLWLSRTQQHVAPESLAGGSPSEPQESESALFATDLKIEALQHQLEGANSQVSLLQSQLCEAKASLGKPTAAEDELRSQLESLKMERSTEYMRRVTAEKKVTVV